MEMTQSQSQPQLSMNNQLMTLYNKIKIRKLMNLSAIKNNTQRPQLRLNSQQMTLYNKIKIRKLMNI